MPLLMRQASWYGRIQPPAWPTVNQAHPLARGLVSLVLASQGNRRPKDLVMKNAQWSSTVATWSSQRRSGQAFRTAAATNVSTTALNFTAPPYSVAVFFNIDVFTTANQHLIWSRRTYTSETVNTGWSLAGHSTGAFVFGTYANNGGGIYGLTGTKIRANGDWLVVGTVTPTTKSLYVNGRLDASNAVGLTCLTSTGDLQVQSATELAWLYAGYGWNRALTSAEVWELYLNPYAMLNGPPSLRLRGAAAAPGGIVRQMLQHGLYASGGGVG
jgi:hypothetical protein